MSKKYKGLNFVDVVVTPTAVTPATKAKRRMRLPAALVITVIMCTVVLGVWLGRSLGVPHFSLISHYIRQAISFDVWPGGSGDGKLQFVADWMYQAGVYI